MSVTQDYKILTLTPSEYLAVRPALVERHARLSDDYQHGRYGRDSLFQLQAKLADVQSAMAKEPAVVKGETLTHNQICARAIAQAFDVEEVFVLSAAVAEYHSRYFLNATVRRGNAILSAWDKLHLAVQVAN